MHPMTTRLALQIVTAPPHMPHVPGEYDHARRILDALVELREAALACEAAITASRSRCTSTTEAAARELVRIADDRLDARLAAAFKLAALERGEEPKS